MLVCLLSIRAHDRDLALLSCLGFRDQLSVKDSSEHELTVRHPFIHLLILSWQSITGRFQYKTRNSSVLPICIETTASLAS